MTHRNAPRMKPPPLFMTAPKAAGGDDLPVMQDDQHPLERPADRGGARRDAGAGRPRRVADPGRPTRPSRPSRRSRRPRRTARSPAASWASRCSRRSATPRRHWPPRRTRSTSPTARRATTTTRSSRTPSTLAWDGDDLIVHDASQGVTHTAWSLAQVFGIEREQVHRHLALCRRRLRRQDAVAASDPGGRGGEARRAAGAHRRCRARACTAWSAAAPSPSSGWRSAPRPTAASTR